MKRGEIWTISGGSDFAGKPRPALIVQADQFDATTSLTVCPLTTVLRDADILRPSVPSNGATGLSQQSQIMIDKLSAVKVSKFWAPGWLSD